MAWRCLDFFSTDCFFQISPPESRKQAYFSPQCRPSTLHSTQTAGSNNVYEWVNEWINLRGGHTQAPSLITPTSLASPKSIQRPGCLTPTFLGSSSFYCWPFKKALPIKTSLLEKISLLCQLLQNAIEEKISLGFQCSQRTFLDPHTKRRHEHCSVIQWPALWKLAPSPPPPNNFHPSFLLPHTGLPGAWGSECEVSTMHSLPE